MEEASCQARDAMQVEALEAMMEEWQAGCQCCRAWGVQGQDHKAWECRREEAEQVQGGVEAFEKMKRWAAYSCCFDCGLPQAICESFQFDIVRGGHRKQQGIACQYARVLVETVMAIWVRYEQEFRIFIEETMKQDGWVARTRQEREDGPGMEAISWFCEKKRWGGIEGNKMSWFVLQVGERIRV